MTPRLLTVLRLVDPLTPGPRPGDDGLPPGPDTPLGELLSGMQSESPVVREAAWTACYQRYHRVVWTRVFYVMRSISWLREPGEEAADVASDLFVGLPEAARHYREEGNAEAWLKRVAIRAALRRKESLTGRWATGKKAGEGEQSAPAGTGRSYAPLEDMVDQIARQLDEVEQEELLELERRIEGLRSSPDATERRWAEFIGLYRAGYGFEEIGQRMGLTEGSARNWLWKIRKHLAQPPPPRLDAHDRPDA